MLKLVSDNNLLSNYLMDDAGINYFILLTLEREKYEHMYEKKWVQLNSQNEISSILVKRRTGNVQFYSKGSYDSEELASHLSREGFKKLFAEKSVFEQLGKFLSFRKIEEGSYISVLKNAPTDIIIKPEKKDSHYKIRRMSMQDLNEVIRLYCQVFKGFATKQSMIDKLMNESGRGYCAVVDSKIVSVGQSSFEQKSSAVITGVATLPEYREMGIGSGVTLKLCSELLEEGKECFLQYDNEIAGKMYKTIGFKQVGRMITCHY